MDKIVFNSNSEPTMGIELELGLVDNKTLALSNSIQEVLAKLPAEQQLLIQLRYVKKLSLQEIARIMKMKNLWRVHRKLQKALKVMKRELLQRDIGPSDLDIL